MTGWPTFAPWRRTSSTKFGERWVPNARLNVSTQLGPHEGVPACAVPAVSPAARPEVRVRAAAAAKTFDLILMSPFRVGFQPHPAWGWPCDPPALRPAGVCVRGPRAQYRRDLRISPLRPDPPPPEDHPGGQQRGPGDQRPRDSGNSVEDTPYAHYGLRGFALRLGPGHRAHCRARPPP